MIKPLGAGLTAAALLLALSPDARKTARKWAVKAAEIALDLTEQAKEATASVRQQLQTDTEEARTGHTDSFSGFKK